MSFIEHFASLDDPRSHINKRHDLHDILFLVVTAVLSGAEGWKDIKEFGDEKLARLRKFRAFEEGIPVDDTIARVMSALHQKFLDCFVSWVNEVRQAQGQDVIAMDGKTLRRSITGKRSSALHMVSPSAVACGHFRTFDPNRDHSQTLQQFAIMRSVKTRTSACLLHRLAQPAPEN